MLPESYKIPDVTLLDYSDVEAVCACQHLLCKIYEYEGGLDYPPVRNYVTRQVILRGKTWLKKVEALINQILECEAPKLNLAIIPKLMESYDFLYRICFGKTRQGYFALIKSRLTAKWLMGNKSISQTEIVVMLLTEIYSGSQSIEMRYVEYALGIMESWIEELTKCGKFTNSTFLEDYQRLTFLLAHDLSAYLGNKYQHDIKKQWINKYSLFEDRLRTLSASELGHYIAFATTASTILEKSINECYFTEIQLTTLLASHPTIHPYTRQALDLDTIRRFHLQNRG